MKTIGWDYLGMVSYAAGLELQSSMHAKLRARGSSSSSGSLGSDGFLIMLEHYPVITDGRFGRGTNFLLPESEIEKRGVEVFSTGRGGDVTFHGPGQLVAYPIINLREFNLGARLYVHALEEVIINLLRGFGIDGARREAYPGVWAGEEKIASIGISVKNGITMHGCAININTDLGYFSMIVPCGIEGAEVTSIQEILGEEQAVALAAESFARIFGDVFKISPEKLTGAVSMMA